MFRRLIPVAAAALLLVAPVSSHAALSAYTQSFESLVQADPNALAGDGWVVYGNVFSGTTNAYLYGYGSFPAPNGGSAFCSIDAGQGGPNQGLQQLSVYSDYNNGDHANGNWIESNVYREQVIALADVGSTWTFQFDAKLGNLTGTSTAWAFIKTLDPANGYVTTNFLQQSTTAIPTTWNTYSLQITITPGLVGQLLQIGFANRATSYIGSAVFYDNVVFSKNTTGVGPAPVASAFDLRLASPNPVVGRANLDWSLPVAGNAELAVYDVTGRRVASLFHGTADAGLHRATWDGRTSDGLRAPAGVYRAVLRTDAGLKSRSLVIGL